MPEERAPTQESRIEDRLDRLAEDVAELKGEVRQMSQRITNVEQGQRWILGLILGTWVTLAMGIVGLYFKG